MPKKSRTQLLTVTAQVECVVAFPGTTTGRTDHVIVAMALAVATVLLSSAGEAAEFTVLHHRGDDPVDAGVAADSFVLGVDKDDLVVLVRGILADPVRVEDTETAALLAGTFLGLGTEGALELELGNTTSHGFTVADTLANLTLAATTLDADAVDHVALLGLETTER